MGLKNVAWSRLYGNLKLCRRASKEVGYSTEIVLHGRFLESVPEVWILRVKCSFRALRDVNDEINMEIDLDAEKGQQSREGRTNRHRVMIRKTGAVNMAALKGYIEGQMVFDNSILEAISKRSPCACKCTPLIMLDFLDHLLRETPSKNMFAIKRSFFHPLMVERSSISGGVEAMKGVYQSIRLGQVLPQALFRGYPANNYSNETSS